AESRSADPSLRAGRAHPGGAEGEARTGNQSRAPGAAKRRPARAEEPECRWASPAAAPRERDRGAGGTGRSVRAGGHPPAARVVCAEGGAGGGGGCDHVTGGPPPFCPAEAVFRAQRARRHHSRRDGASAPRASSPPAPRPRPSFPPPRLAPAAPPPFCGRALPAEDRRRGGAFRLSPALSRSHSNGASARPSQPCPPAAAPSTPPSSP
ncbi:hypothetical protein Nmel_014294, partial [Mimus melanotis]